MAAEPSSPGRPSAVRLLGALLLLLLDGLCRGEEGDGVGRTVWLNASGLGGEDTESGASSTIYFNNPHLLKDVRKGMLDGGSRVGQRPGAYDTETIGGVYLQDEAQVIATQLRNIAGEELGVNSLQAVFDSLSLAPLNFREEDMVKEMAERLRVKVSKYTLMLQRSKRHIQELYWWHLGSSLCHTLPCCTYWVERLQHSEHFGKRISRSNSCDVVPPLLPSGTFCPGQNLTQIFRENLKEHPTVKWQYFITADSGILTQFPAHDVDSGDGCKDPDETRHREMYISTVSPQAKYVIIMVDHGNSQSPRQLSIAKAIAKYIIGSLSHSDQVGLIGLSAEPSYPRSDDCLTRRMVSATLEAKLHFTRFIDGLTKTKDATNHSLGFAKAFQMMRNTLHLQNVTNYGSSLIVYISRGLLSSLTDAKIVLETIAHENEQLGDQVTINTYAVIDEGKPLMYEKRFLEDISNQNFTKFLPNQFHRQAKQGAMTAVNTTRNLALILGNPFEVLHLPAPNRHHISLLHWDSLGKGLVLSIAEPCFHGDRVIGVVGVDTHLADLAEDVSCYNQAANSYAFVADVAGYVVAHPLFTRASVASEQPVHTDIGRLENRPGFAEVWDKMSRLNSGVELLVISCVNHSDSVQHIKYAWKKVEGTGYIICIVTENPDLVNRVPKTNEVAAHSDIVYHRLDMVPEVKKCRHLKQLATTKAASLFLSSLCFHSSFEFLNQDETRRSIQGYMAYMSDATKLIANPGLKNNVRSDVAALVTIIPQWKKRFAEAPYSQYIVRRYAATPRGVFQVYPGTAMDKAYDPTKRPWYTRAMEYPGRVILSPPYLDSGGAGYIITLSHTIHEKRSSGPHGAMGAGVVAVLGMDFTLGYLHKMVMDIVPACNQDRVACFILDDKGYLNSHPALIEPSGKGPVEQQHITHKEPLVANDILNHKAFVRKKLCNSFGDRTVQRFYQFNTSLEGTLTNLVHGEHCAKYQIVSVPGTNVFMGIVNQTCDMVTAFCPCSMVDRLCLNCHRMEQSECECPCECPLEVDLCTGHLLDKEDANPICTGVPDDIRSVDVDPQLLEALEPCVEARCPGRVTQSDCFGVMGCEWCQLDSDAHTPMAQPFCAEQRRCFGGVLGARTPYADEVVGLPSEELLSIKSTPVGPVAGGIMGCFLVLALGVYCYRHHVHRSGAHQYVSSVPDTHVRMSQLDEVDDVEPPEEPSAAVGVSNMVLAGCEQALNISPYRINTGYRRPAGGDSDHGYSTMTPHEDSEHMHYVEPLIVGRDRHRPAVHLHQPAPSSGVNSSSSTASSCTPPATVSPQEITALLEAASWRNDFLATTSPTAKLLPTSDVMGQTTLLPDIGNRVLASVQVHMVDTH